MYCFLKGVHIEAFNMHWGMTAQNIEWKVWYYISYCPRCGIIEVVQHVYGVVVVTAQCPNYWQTLEADLFFAFVMPKKCWAWPLPVVDASRVKPTYRTRATENELQLSRPDYGMKPSSPRWCGLEALLPGRNLLRPERPSRKPLHQWRYRMIREINSIPQKRKKRGKDIM